MADRRLRRATSDDEAAARGRPAARCCAPRARSPRSTARAPPAGFHALPPLDGCAARRADAHPHDVRRRRPSARERFFAHARQARRVGRRRARARARPDRLPARQRGGVRARRGRRQRGGHRRRDGARAQPPARPARSGPTRSGSTTCSRCSTALHDALPARSATARRRCCARTCSRAAWAPTGAGFFEHDGLRPATSRSGARAGVHPHVGPPPFQRLLDEHRDAGVALPASRRSGARTPTTASRRRSSPRCAPTRACRPSANLRGLAADDRPPQGDRPAPRARRAGRVPVEDAAGAPARATPAPTAATRELWSAVRALPPKQRARCVLRFVGDLTHARDRGGARLLRGGRARAACTTASTKLRKEWTP